MLDTFLWARTQALALEELRARHPRPEASPAPAIRAWRRGSARTLRALADRLDGAAKRTATASSSS